MLKKSIILLSLLTAITGCAGSSYLPQNDIKGLTQREYLIAYGYFTAQDMTATCANYVKATPKHYASIKDTERDHKALINTARANGLDAKIKREIQEDVAEKGGLKKYCTSLARDISSLTLK